MPHLVTCVCTVFHGKVAFPFLSSSTRKVYFAASLSQGGCSGFLSDAEILRLVGSGDAGHELDAFWAQFEKRRRLMNDWASYCAKAVPPAAVTPLRAGRA